jgi:phosphotransferase system enzyme I (PtsP)
VVELRDRGTDLLRDVGRLLVRSHDLGETLDNLVRLVARWMRAGGCSIYLNEDDGETLVLRATRGLREESVGQVRLAVGEGIVGACLASGKPVNVPDVKRDARFVPFPETGEERFRSMLAVPLRVREQPVGVLTVQTRRSREFSPDEIDLLETISVQVAAIVLNARLLDRASRLPTLAPAPPVQAEPFARGSVQRGLAISPGITTGPVHIQTRALDLDAIEYQPARSRTTEWRNLERALRETVRQISDLRAAVGERFGDEFADVFTTHIMILEDVSFREKLRRHVFEHGDGARALVEAMREYMAIFRGASDELIRERATDIEDVVRRAIAELLGVRSHNPPLRDGVIVVAERIVPSDFVLLETEKIAGIVSEHGGPTSHAAIFARSLGTPSVTGLHGLVERIRPTDRVLVDGLDGAVIVNPTQEQLREHRHKLDGFERALARLDELRDEPACTVDGVEILQLANIGGLNDLELVKRYGARGVGLFRTEILALFSRGFPDEEEQVEIYRRVGEMVAPDPVTVRTFDMGGDKGSLGGEVVIEDNPQLGWRSIRMLLDLEGVLDAQLRAIMRANTGGNLRVMIPMVTAMEELDAVRVILERAARDVGVAKPPPLGVMIETPAAVAIADRLAREVDFFSIGTNDLVQYMLAVDRENELVASAYDPFHPAVLSQLRRVADVAREAGIPCSVCGELAGNPIATPVLIGLGIRELSMTPFSVALVRPIIHRTNAADAATLVDEVETCSRASEVRARLATAYAEMGLLDDREFGPMLERLLRRGLVDSDQGGQ